MFKAMWRTSTINSLLPYETVNTVIRKTRSAECHFKDYWHYLEHVWELHHCVYMVRKNYRKHLMFKNMTKT